MIGIVVLAVLALGAPPTLSALTGDDDVVSDFPDFNPLGSTGLIPLVGIPLQVRRENVLASPSRRRLFELVQAHPGIHLRGLVHASGLGFGAVSYHLRVLQAYGFVSAVPSGPRVCFYPVGVEPVSAIPRISRRRIQVLEALERSPGAGLGSLGEELGLSPKTVAYHVRALRAAGFVEAECPGRPLRLRRSLQDDTARR